MINRFINKKVMLILFALGAILIAIFNRGLYPSLGQSAKQAPAESRAAADMKTRVVSTDPSPLEGVTVLPNQKVSLTFDHPLVNSDEVKHHFEPDIAHVVKVSDDRKTVTITPNPAFAVGRGYTLFVSNDTKFADGAKLPDTLIYHLKTIEYRGI